MKNLCDRCRKYSKMREYDYRLCFKCVEQTRKRLGRRRS